MIITKEEVARIARLARLDPGEDKLAEFAPQLDKVLTYMDLLGEVDTADVEPMYSPIETPQPLRVDEATNKPMRDELLAPAPEDDGAHFIVPKIV
jgi:aspartyl-tRNA(Asn)/glutamyl-tRNA(Gln) amidotransferase subunit C